MTDPVSQRVDSRSLDQSITPKTSWTQWGPWREFLKSPKNKIRAPSKLSKKQTLCFLDSLEGVKPKSKKYCPRSTEFVRLACRPHELCQRSAQRSPEPVLDDLQRSVWKLPELTKQNQCRNESMNLFHTFHQKKGQNTQSKVRTCKILSVNAASYYIAPSHTKLHTNTPLVWWICLERGYGEVEFIWSSSCSDIISPFPLSILTLPPAALG